MDDVIDDPSPPVVTAFRRRGRPFIAWLVISLCVGFTIVMQMRRSAPTEDGDSDQGLMVMQVQARYLIGTAEILKQGGQDIARQAAQLNTGPVGQRLRYIVLLGELAGPEKALEQLDRLDQRLAEQQVELSPTQAQLRDTLRRLYGDYAAKRLDAPSLSVAQKALLQKELGWFGRLALAPKDGPDAAARQEVLAATHDTFLGMMIFGGSVLLLGAIGTITLLAILILLLTRRLQTHFRTGSGTGAIYAETFAVWMVLFLLLTAGAGRLPLAGELRLAAVASAMLLSLTALAWPVLRGLSWRQARQEIGLTAGPKPAAEPLFGVSTYLMALPLLAIGLGLTLLLMRIQHNLQGLGDPTEQFTPGNAPSHPIVDALLHLGWWGRIQILLLASVVAPLVEETMFRGVLYRHLREASVPLGRFGSALFSATVVSFLFAVIHPQGLIAVPALMALAYAFALAREWRGSLVAAMVAHGINNALVFTLVILLAAP
jgi:membrane protease YdiL (CAAX protease family)